MDFVQPVQAVLPGTQGRLLAVLAETTAELNLRTLARLAGVSIAQASRVLARLVDLGLVERREAPPSALFRLVPEHVAAGPLLGLAAARDRLLDLMRQLARGLPVPPSGLIAFGSFARGDASSVSDIDVVIVRPDGVDADDEAWGQSVDRWRLAMRRASGNRIQALEVAAGDLAAKLDHGGPLWQEIAREGIVVMGPNLEEVADSGRA